MPHSGRRLEGRKTLCVVDDASYGSDGRHNGDEPAEGAEGLQRNPVGRENLDLFLHDVHLDLRNTAPHSEHSMLAACAIMHTAPQLVPSPMHSHAGLKSAGQG